MHSRFVHTITKSKNSTKNSAHPSAQSNARLRRRIDFYQASARISL